MTLATHRPTGHVPDRTAVADDADDQRLGGEGRDADAFPPVVGVEGYA